MNEAAIRDVLAPMLAEAGAEIVSVEHDLIMLRIPHRGWFGAVATCNDANCLRTDARSILGEMQRLQDGGAPGISVGKTLSVGGQDVTVTSVNRRDGVIMYEPAKVQP